MKTTLNLLAVILLTFGLQPLAFSQGTAFTYQGRLNVAGAPANGTYDLAFTLFPTNATGTAIAGPVTNAAVAVSNGLFTTTLDFGNQFPGAGRWLEIAVRPNGGGSFATLSPRQALTSTPYSIQSANAASAASAGSVAAGNITGTLTTAQLPSAVVTNGASGVTISGNFSGNGAGVTNVPGTMPWQSVPGSGLTAAANQAYLLTNNATTVTLPSTANVGDMVTVSGTGTNAWQVVPRSGQAIAGYPAGIFWTDNNNAPVTFWRSVASSADGANLVAVVNNGPIYTSTDSGATWSANNNAPSAAWSSVASSADGASLVAVINNGRIYTSTNSGVTWSTNNNAPSNTWSCVASSANGTRLVAVANLGHIYTSADSGVTWVRDGAKTAAAWSSVASSADGTKLVAAANGDLIYTSTNSGVTWLTVNNAPSANWQCVASSADGSNLVAVVKPGQIYTSSDSGITWSANNNAPSQNWQSVASSADGTKLVAVGETVTVGQIYTSTDSGITWSASNNAPSRAWFSVASSADGAKLVAPVYHGLIYTSRAGYVGSSGVAVQFQYVGSGVWQPVSQAAGQIVGTIPASDLPPGVVTNGESDVVLSGIFTGNIYSEGYLGIGTTAPNYPLSFGSTPGDKLALYDSGSGNFYGFGINNAELQVHTDTSAADIVFGSGLVAAFTEVMRIKGTGNVGIGTTNPAATLDINGSANVSGLFTANGGVGIGTTNPALNTVQINPAFESANGYGLVVSKASFGENVQINRTAGQGGIGLVVDDAAAGDASTSLLLVRNNVNGGAQYLLDVLANGNVGIGTVSPANKLDVQGSADFSGNVGIGTAGPANKLDVQGSADFSGNVGIGTASPANKLDVQGSADFSGNVGIGTTAPTRGSLEIDTQNGSQPGYNPAGFLDASGAAYGSIGAGGGVSIWAAGWVFATEFVAFSDERIKNIQGQSDSAADLNTLLGIKITDFTYKDTIARGNRPQKKVIAQQVEQVFPQAVSTNTDVVPDIYRKATLKDGWVRLATDLKVGDRVKLIAEKEKGIYPVLEVRDGAFRTDFKPSTEQVFVYGREVKDFRNVDYEAIAMLNVSATQELARKVTSLERTVAQVLAENEALLKGLSALEARDRDREDRLARISASRKQGHAD